MSASVFPPQLCNKGYGRQILALVRQIAAQLYPNKPLYLEVRCWNRRAIACYQRAGFCIEGEAFEQTTPMGKGSFYRMVCPAAATDNPPL